MRSPYYVRREGPDGIPAAMVELSSEHDWDELPPDVQEAIRVGAAMLQDWAAARQPIAGEVVPEQKEVTP